MEFDAVGYAHIGDKQMPRIRLKDSTTLNETHNKLTRRSVKREVILF